MQPDAILNAADLCEKSYEEKIDLEPGWEKLSDRVVDLYRSPCQLKAFVVTEPVTQKPRHAYVVFRGTIFKMPGNWLFANFQLYKSKYQDSPLSGTVHMGFYRAFHWLWHGGAEPKPDAAHRRSQWTVFAMRHFFIFLLFVIVTLLTRPDRQIIAWLVFSWFLLIIFETGVLENFFKKRTPFDNNDKSQSLAEQLKELQGIDEIVFTGHSLGGAIATIAFAECQKSGSHQSAMLITFASPRIGDADCMNGFESNPKHAGRYLHVIHVGDVVPESPGTLEQARSLPKGAGWICVVLKFVGTLRHGWALAYQQKPPGKWSEPEETEWQLNHTIMKVGKLPLHKKNHNMSGYKTLTEDLINRLAER